MIPESSRRIEMSDPRKIQRKQSRPPFDLRQMSIVFESKGLRGLSTAERTKVLVNLAHLLILAAEVVVEEDDDER